MNLEEVQAAEVEEITAAVAGIADVAVFTDSTEALGQLAAGGLALIVPPPAIEFASIAAWSMTWEVWVLAPTTDPTQTTAQVSPVVAALCDHGAASAKPDQFQTPNGGTFAGYVVTTQSTYGN